MINPNPINFTFIDYKVIDTGILMHFLADDPGGGEVGDYYILLTDAEATGVASVPALAALCKTKLQRQIRAPAWAAKLDPLKGQVITGV